MVSVPSVDDADVFAGVSDVGRVLDGGHGALRRRRPWSMVRGEKALATGGGTATRSRCAEAAGIQEWGCTEWVIPFLGDVERGNSNSN